ncbi:hypothetical protein HH214_05125 [Mucilaginibacter robiniae]|uniref:Tetratricopeptide repeat protein n=1 Tax=Mucilaginibacter robiniae TaxID=2728022 RepID=A0A7L5DYV3_9SPHI|nr:hypothetical protein [Mucilaginibacter robiniae]QJD95297.1 hypothetical protein HH214_05125 [Mucilaginibacter robiniae]
MKLTKEIVGTTLGLVFIGSSVFAQSLDDAKKAIDAEQYQKAKSMLKNLTTTQPTKDENFFYLGWVYLQQDYPDSAKAAFNKGIAANAKSAINYAGLGAVAHYNKDAAGAQSNFNQAATLAGKSPEPYVYIAKGYLLDPNPNADAAITVLNKEIGVNAKDPNLFIALGDAYRAQMKSSEAYKAYSTALDLNPKSPSPKVSTGVLWRFANNWEDSEKEFQAAIAIDPNFGPAYREWAETDIRWANKDPKMASAKIQEAVDHYKKFLSLTDMSVESQVRYADFLYSAGRFKELQDVANSLTKYPGVNLKVYRYLGYSAYENGDYATSNTALNTWFSKADPKRVIPYDYYYQGRNTLKAGKDTAAAIQELQKAVQADTTGALSGVYGDIAGVYYAQRKYEQAGDAYQQYATKSNKATLNDYFKEGFSYYFAYGAQLSSKATPKPTPDTTLLVKADSAFAHIQSKLGTTPNSTVTQYRARLYDLKEKDRNNIVGYAKPFYEKFVTEVSGKSSLTDADKKGLAEAYAYLGNYAEYKDKDTAKATEYFTKARDNDPTNAQVQYYFTKKGKPAAGKGK